MPTLRSVEPGPPPGPLAFLGDIHGNWAALEPVLEALDREGATRLFAVGDLLFGGDTPLEVWRALEARGAVCIRGASDTALVTLEPAVLAERSGADRDRVVAFLETRSKVGDLVLERLRRLPERHRIPLPDGREIVMVHGSPADPLTEITHDLEDEEVLALVDDDPADLIVCAGSHVPFHRIMGDVQVLNVGSVGASPEGRVAHYALVTPAPGGPIVEQRWVEY